MRHRPLKYVLVLAALFGLAWWLVRHTYDPLRSELKHLRTATVPPQAHILKEPSLHRTGNSAHAEWEWEMNWIWPRYAEWVGGRLTTTYISLESTPPLLRFRRSLPSDVFYLELQPTLTSGNCRVRATFTALPD